MTLELLPRSLGVGDVIDAANQRTHAEAERRMLSLEHLAPAFTLLTDRTGRAVGPETMRLYAEHFATVRVSVEAVYEAVRDVVRTWEKAYWPTAEYLGNVAQRKQRGAQSGAADRDSAMQEAAMDIAQREWQDRLHRSLEWGEANPKEATLLLAGIDADLDGIALRSPSGRVATQERYRKAFRSGSAVGACLRRMAIAHTPDGRRELRALNERFPDLAVDLYASA